MPTHGKEHGKKQPLKNALHTEDKTKSHHHQQNNGNDNRRPEESFTMEDLLAMPRIEYFVADQEVRAVDQKCQYPHPPSDIQNVRGDTRDQHHSVGNQRKPTNEHKIHYW
ncbi:hypothetical protein FQZ97_1194950 [compost metagenome]